MNVKISLKPGLHTTSQTKAKIILLNLNVNMIIYSEFVTIVFSSGRNLSHIGIESLVTTGSGLLNL